MPIPSQLLYDPVMVSASHEICNAVFGPFVFRGLGGCSLLLAFGHLRDADAVLR